MNTKYLDLYTDYLAVTFGSTTSTGLSSMLEGSISHDKFTRFPAWANKFIDQWTADVMQYDSLPEIRKFAKSVLRHRELILNYFRAKKEYSSGTVEGFNNKTKLTIRKSCGFRNDELREIALFHGPGKLELPDFTHRFV